MKLEGSCHCGRVRFSVESAEPWPYQRCYCSICRKTGGSEFMINLGGDAASLVVEGREHTKEYRAVLQEPRGSVTSRHHRVFCGTCGSQLWAYHEDWPELVHPVASAIDTPLPRPPAHVHMMVGSAAPWVTPNVAPEDEVYEDYPQRSLAEWHARHGYRES